MSAEVAVQRHYRIRGRVQGVGFRYFVSNEARSRGIRGWVRNRRDGSVEALAVAGPEVLDDFEKALARGPRWGRVDAIEASGGDEPEGSGAGFEIRNTV